MKKITIIALIIALCALNTAFAADIYLDNAVSQSTSYNPASRTNGSGTSTVYTTLYAASNALKSGDTLYIRQGEYWQDITGTAGYNWTGGALHIGVSNAVVTNYNGEEVWIKGGASRTSVVNHPNNAVLMDGSGNVLRGIDHNLKVYGCIIMSGSGNVLEGLDISGGWDHQSPIGGDAWYDVIRFRDSTNAVVRNCKIHDNYNHGTNTAGTNKALMMHERDVNTLVENCDFYNPVTGYVYAKYQSSSGTVHVTYRKNWFVRGSGAMDGISGPNHSQGKQILIYQNVFINGGAAFYRDTLDGRNFIIYNNVFYNVQEPLWSWSTGSIATYQFFNNIVYSSAGTSYAIDFNEVPGSITGGYYDYNRYYTAGGNIVFRHNYRSYGSLSSWNSYLGTGDGTEDHSGTGNPNFVPDDGSLDGSQPSDFKRSAYPTSEGRGGQWPSVIGAYLQSSDVIGTYGSSVSHTYVAAPQNLHTN